MIAYSVTCTFQNESLAREWLEWIESEHLGGVIAAGAIDAEVVILDGNPMRCETRYHFASREEFNIYEREHAPRLRNEGLKKFPLTRGMSYVRSMGEVVVTKSPARVSFEPKPKRKPKPKLKSKALPKPKARSKASTKKRVVVR